MNAFLMPRTNRVPKKGRRHVLKSNHAFDILRQRCGEKREGMSFPAKPRRVCPSHHNGEDIFAKPESRVGRPEALVLFCRRHDYATRTLKRTVNLAAVMRTMGHKEVKTAMQYQQPELEISRAVLDQNAAVKKRVSPD